MMTAIAVRGKWRLLHPRMKHLLPVFSEVTEEWECSTVVIGVNNVDVDEVEDVTLPPNIVIFIPLPPFPLNPFLMQLDDGDN